MRTKAKIVKVSKPKFRSISQDDIEVELPMAKMPEREPIDHLISKNELEKWLQEQWRIIDRLSVIDTDGDLRGQLHIIATLADEFKLTLTKEKQMIPLPKNEPKFEIAQNIQFDIIPKDALRQFVQQQHEFVCDFESSEWSNGYRAAIDEMEKRFKLSLNKENE